MNVEIWTVINWVQVDRTQTKANSESERASELERERERERKVEVDVDFHWQKQSWLFNEPLLTFNKAKLSYSVDLLGKLHTPFCCAGSEIIDGAALSWLLAGIHNNLQQIHDESLSATEAAWWSVFSCLLMASWKRFQVPTTLFPLFWCS